MIAQLSGSIVQIGAASAVLDVQGVGYRVLITAAHALQLRTGEHTTIVTELVVRDDALLLYGFRDVSEREVFGLLTSVSGVGPKSAMAVLGQLTPAELAEAVANDNERAFKTVPGVGPKTAKLILLQLKGKLAVAQPAVTEAVASGATSVVADDVIEALVTLGTQQKQAAAAVAAVLERGADDARDVQSLLRAALQELGGRR
ncbi:Holliday junction branch migration protein RuvA [Gulosibacter hominis]|uniref:Holliday junction branch migration protein RuvA n=1 Tax=Gulosibacter hominis TaxID=2770504 RepID=UPI00191A3C60|nr:Holliday junction branch migration protein RuvA [Gulosibacter hominis]